VTASQPTRPVAVVGGGITGLVAARTIARAGLPVVVFEATHRFGGKVRTEELEGRPAEAGPDSFVARDPGAERLCRELGLGGELVAPEAFGAHVWRAGKLRALPAKSVLGIPSTPLGVVASGMLSPLGALRALGDLVIPGPLTGPDVSVASLVRRRFGPEVLERLVDPVLAGTRAGRPDDISLAAGAPELDAAARSHRSVVLALARRRGAGPPRFLGLEPGMARLVERLVAELGERAELRTDAPVSSISTSDGGVVVDASGRRAVAAAAVVLATPAFAAAEALGTLAADAARELRRIRYASVALASLVYPPGAATLPPEGSGILVPSSEGRALAGCTWTARKWPHLAPSDGALSVRCFMGTDDDGPARDDVELVRLADRELRAAMQLRAPPRASRVDRWERALPIYSVGHGAVVERAQQALAPWPRIALAGAAYRGPGIADCIHDAEAAARRLLSVLSGEAAADAAIVSGPR
jgi:oxygen-dependent protoporphyrinogen oxidase